MNVSRKRYRVLSALLLLSLLSAINVRRVKAESEPKGVTDASTDICDISQKGTDSLRLICDFDLDGSMLDALTILYGDSGAQSELEWNDPLLLENAIWIFDYKADSVIELAIRFVKQGNSLQADLYTTPSDELLTALNIEDGSSTSSAIPGFPEVRVIAHEGWWSDDGKVNFNLDILTDGPIVTALVSEKIFADVFTVDGISDTTITIRDTDNDGRPDYDWRTLHFPEPRPESARTIAPSYLMVNAEDNELPFQTVFPWPYLGSLSYGYLVSSPNSTGPPIQIDWSRGEIPVIGEFVRSRGNDSQWFVYSQRLLEAGKLNTPNFESPFAWYDLAGDEDHVPELSIRLVHYEANDSDFLGGAFNEPFNQIRYSWDQDNDGNWDNKLGLFGRHDVNSVVELPEMALKVPSYEELPEWVLGRGWEAATFVASEEGRPGEGIYEWDFSPWVYEQYFTGESEMHVPPRQPQAIGSELPFNELDQIGIGFRGEYQLNYSNRPMLYLSSIDNLLHLKWAEQGIWRLNEDQIIKLSNLDSDETIDVWSREVKPIKAEEDAGTQALSDTDSATQKANKAFVLDDMVTQPDVIEVLYALDGHLLHSDDSRVTLLKTDYESVLLETLPPTDKKTWETLRAQLSAYEDQRRDPTNLRVWLEAFSGPRSKITGASLANVRIIDDGYRFELALAPGSQVAGTDLLSIAGRPPGVYLVQYDGAFHIEPATPPDLEIALKILAQSRVPSRLSLPLQLTISNRGGLAAESVHLFLADGPGGVSNAISEEAITILGRDMVRLTHHWSPPTEPAGQLRVWAEDDGGNVLAVASLSLVDLETDSPAATSNLLRLATAIWPPTLILIVLLAFGLIAGLAIWSSREVAP